MSFHVRTRSLVCFTLLLGFLTGLTVPAIAARPTAPRLLPQTTLLYVRVNNVVELIDRFKETSMGQITQDPKIRPLIEQLYGDALKAFSSVEEEVGLSLEQLLKLPQGEACLALVSSETGLPMLTLLLDVGDQLPEAEKLLKKMEQAIVAEGGSKTTETAGDTEITTYHSRGEDPFSVFTREGTVVVCTNTILSKQLLEVWDGTAPSDFKSLADNRKFTAIMKRSAGAEGARPQISYYADPIAMVESFGRSSFTVQAVLATLPALGADGFKAIGGSVILAPENFDSIAHFHVSLDFPRKGILEFFEMKTGDLTPEPWVPANVSSYTSVNWNIEKAFGAIRGVYDAIRGEGGFSQMLERQISDPWGVDFEEDIIGGLDGRFSIATWVEPPARINSQTNLFAFKLKDASRAQKTFKRIMENFNFFTKTNHRGTTYYSVAIPDDENRPDFIRAPVPCLAIVGDYLMFTDSDRFLKRVLVTKGSNSKGLANQLDYKLIASRIRRQAGRQEPSMISFSRPEEILKSLYELATKDSTLDALSRGAEDNPFFRVLDRAVQDSPLPPFEEIAKYLSPRGAMTISDETGLHTISFTLKRK
ncbi:MAG: hypothetical protein VB857_14655 [Pirellulaceae bacterium]